MLHADAEPVLHVKHPRPTPWNSLISSFAQEFGIPTSSYSDWFAALEESYTALYSSSPDAPTIERELRDNPALRLLAFFRSGCKHDDNGDLEPIGITKISCTKATKISEALNSAEMLTGDHVRRWIGTWKKSGFI